jgi:hypothetical protein
MNFLDTNSSNQRNAAAIYYNKAGSFEILHGLLDRIMEVLEVKFSSQADKGKLTYYIKGKDRKNLLRVNYYLIFRSYFLPWSSC